MAEEIEEETWFLDPCDKAFELKTKKDLRRAIFSLQKQLYQLRDDYYLQDKNYQTQIKRMLDKEVQAQEFITNQAKINKVVEELWKRAGSFEDEG